MVSSKQFKDIQTQAYMGQPSILQDICKIYPLFIPEITLMGETQYNSLLGLLLLDENEIADLMKKKTGTEISPEEIDPLTYLILSAANNDTFLLELQTAFMTFVKEEVLILPKINSVLVGDPQERRLITSESFKDFQNILRIQNKKEVPKPPPEDESYGQRKMRLLREKAAAVKRKQEQKNNEGKSLLELLEIAEVFGIDIKNCTLFSLQNQINRHRAKEKWDQDIQMLCAGADSEKIKTKYWGESLEE